MHRLWMVAVLVVSGLGLGLGVGAGSASAAAAPTLTLTPASGHTGDQVTASFPDAALCLTPTTIDWAGATQTAPARQTTFTLTVPALAAGSHQVVASCSPEVGTIAAATTFVVLPPPTVTLAPSSAQPGAAVVATGHDFGGPCIPTLQLDGAALPATDLGTGAARFVVPQGAKTGAHTVGFTCAKQTATAPLTVLAVVTTTPPTTVPTTPPTTAPTTTTLTTAPTTAATAGPIDGGATGPPSTPSTIPATAPTDTGTPPPSNGPVTPTGLAVGGTTAPTPTTSAVGFGVDTNSFTEPLSNRPSFPQALPTPAQLDWSPVAVVISLAIAVGLMFVIGFPAELFHKTIEENRHRLPRWLTRADAPRRPAVRWRIFAAFSVLASVILTFAESDAGWNAHTLVFLVALLAVVPVVTLAYSWTVEQYVRNGRRLAATPRVLGLALVFALICVVLSRRAGFQPAYVYGLFAYFAVQRQSDEREARTGAGALAGGVALLGLGVLAWIAWPPLAEAAARPTADPLVLVADSALATTFVLALQGIVFGLAPVEFMDGRKLWRWNRWAWAGIWAAGTFLFVHVVFRKLLHDFSWPALILALLPFLLFGLGSVGLWAWCVRLRRADERERLKAT